jgi:hypothetical protein
MVQPTVTGLSPHAQPLCKDVSMSQGHAEFPLIGPLMKRSLRYDKTF